jgi:hypothetical protein
VGLPVSGFSTAALLRAGLLERREGVPLASKRLSGLSNACRLVASVGKEFNLGLILRKSSFYPVVNAAGWGRERVSET